jgi:hypothetical protein
MLTLMSILIMRVVVVISSEVVKWWWFLVNHHRLKPFPREESGGKVVKVVEISCN